MNVRSTKQLHLPKRRRIIPLASRADGRAHVFVHCATDLSVGQGLKPLQIQQQSSQARVDGRLTISRNRARSAGVGGNPR